MKLSVLRGLKANESGNVRMRYELNDFIEDVFRIARERGYNIETSRRNKLPQIDIGIKKLHLEHIRKMYPAVLFHDADVGELIKGVAPGRPCAHKPFREIVEQIHKERKR
jgi:hypothetical protein